MNYVLTRIRSGVLSIAIGLFSAVGFSGLASASDSDWQACEKAERAAPTASWSGNGSRLVEQSTQIVNVSISGGARVNSLETQRANGVWDSHRVDSYWGYSIVPVYVGTADYAYPVRVTRVNGVVETGHLTRSSNAQVVQRSNTVAAAPVWTSAPSQSAYVPAPPPARIAYAQPTYSVTSGTSASAYSAGQAVSYVSKPPASQTYTYATPTYQSASPTYAATNSYAAAIPTVSSAGFGTTYDYGTSAAAHAPAQPTASWQGAQQQAAVWGVRPSAQASVYTPAPAATYGQAARTVAYPSVTVPCNGHNVNLATTPSGTLRVSYRSDPSPADINPSLGFPLLTPTEAVTHMIYDRNSALYYCPQGEKRQVQAFFAK